MPEQSAALLEGLRAFDVVSEATLLDGSYWAQNGTWCFRFEMAWPVLPNSYIPSQTIWYALVADTYPFGRLEIHPAAEGGITATFPHQALNTYQAGMKWRDGHICVQTTAAVWDKSGFDSEPYTAAERLGWHLERTAAWIRAAAGGRLTEAGDPFELPYVRHKAKGKIAYQETADSFEFWARVERRSGLVHVLEDPSGVWVVRRFQIGRDTAHEYEWGERFRRVPDTQTGIWILLPAIPVIDPWQVPLTWRDLCNLSERMGVDLRKELTPYFKGGKSYFPVLMIGFPMPEHWQGPDARVHWMAISLPKPPAVAARPGTDAYTALVLNAVFAPSKEIAWVETENWDPKELTARGLLSPTMRDRNVFIIGCGAIGSLVAELLVRLGVTKIQLIDGDGLVAGNFSRHTLDMNALGQPKAEALARRLNAIFPQVQAKGYSQRLAVALRKQPALLRDCTLCIDASASDEVLQLLEHHLSTQLPLVSVFSSYKAKQLYLVTMPSGPGTRERIQSKTAPLLAADAAGEDQEAGPREGVGCWHPLFPARYDRLMMMVSAALSHIEGFVASGHTSSRLTLFTPQHDENGVLLKLKVSHDDTL